MSDLFASGRIIDLVLVLVAVEAVALVVLRRARGGLAAASLDMLPNLLSGAFLMLAVRAALTQAAWSTVALFLALALVAHLSDLARRLGAPSA